MSQLESVVNAMVRDVNVRFAVDGVFDAVKIVDLSPGAAILTAAHVPGKLGEYPIWIGRYDDIYEVLVCTHLAQFSDKHNVPAGLMYHLLEENARSKDNYWCIQDTKGGSVVGIITNIRAVEFESGLLAKVMVTQLIRCSELDDFVLKMFEESKK